MQHLLKRPALVAVAASTLAIGVMGCTNDTSGDKTPSSSTSTTVPARSAATDIAVPDGTVIGVVVSSAGAGRDLKDLAAGVYVAAARINGDAVPAKLRLEVVDDAGTADGARSAIAQLAAADVSGVVYASTGDQLRAGVEAASAAGLPVVLPWASDASLAGTNVWLTGPTDRQAAGDLVRAARDLDHSKIAVMAEDSAYGAAGKATLLEAGAEPVTTATFTPGARDLKAQAKAIVDSGADAVIVWSGADDAGAVFTALQTAGFHGQQLLAPRGAVPALTASVASSLAPPLEEGLVSVGTWAGPALSSPGLDAFYRERANAVKSGSVTADVSRADPAAHDAVIALAQAAAKAGSNDPAAVASALPSIAFDGAGPPLDFSRPLALADGDVAALTMTSLDDGRKRVPSGDPRFVPVEGTYTLPPTLIGADNAAA